jgi:cytochrome c biogenesis protein CcdA/thiol-disulfide isomerase/thioredoxin
MLFVLAYLGGVLTIVSPCILPVLPFVFARADRPFLRGGLPLLVGLTVTFAGVASIATVAGAWAVRANEYGRVGALVLLAIFGVALLFPALADRMMRPFVALGARLTTNTAAEGDATVLSSLLLGVATGLLWAPCAGPILGLILTGAALRGTNVATAVLLLAYAAGAATSLALALLIGGRVFMAMKRSLAAGEWVRRGLGVAVLAAVVAIASGVDTGFLTQISLASTTSVEQRLLDRFHATPALPAARSPSITAAGTLDLPVGEPMPSLSGATAWLNSPPLTTVGLKGKVVLVDFWTYSCINCLRAAPYIRAWAEKYRNEGLVVIGVHTPEFAFEQNIDNVKKAVASLKIGYPVAIDNDYAIWRAFENEFWPADYFIDGQGRLRHMQFGEGDYDESERVIQQLLAEAAAKNVPSGLVSVTGTGAEAAADTRDVKSPETYIGYLRAENFVSPGGAVHDSPHTYSVGTPALNDWGLSGDWTIGDESAFLDKGDGAITYVFHARDLHLVLGPGPDGKPVRFRVTIGGRALGNSHGADDDSAGQGIVTEQRLYQLIRQSGVIVDHTFEIRFLDPGVQAFAFTFG